jgi:hypothetical protein
LIRFIYFISICAALVSCQTSPKNAPNKNEKETLEAAPKLTRPVVRKIWIPEKIEDDGLTMTGGHWKYLINKGASWAN